MASNSLYPGFIKYFYTSNGHPHIQVQPVKPFVAVGGANWVEQKANALGILWTTWVANYVTELVKWFPSSANIGRAELWTMASPTADPLFADVVDIDEDGTNGTTSTAYCQAQMTFRSATGGLFRFQVMEPTLAANLELAIGDLGYSASMAALLTGGTSSVVARDGGFLTAGIRLLTKTNDKLREKYLLDA